MSDVVVQKRGRGRPRTKPLQAVIPGKKRGRPKKTETQFKDAGFAMTRVHAPMFEAALENHSNVDSGFNFVFERFFKDAGTNEYFFYKDGMLFSTGIVGNDPSHTVHKAQLEDWKFVNLPKIDALILAADSSKPLMKVEETSKSVALVENT